VKNGILYRQCPPVNGSPGHLQWILPAALRNKFIETLHTDLGHLGEVETCNAVARCIYFPGWRPYTELIVQMCGVCQKPQRREQWNPGVGDPAAGSPLNAGGEGAIAEMQSKIVGLQDAILKAVRKIDWLTCNKMNGEGPPGVNAIKVEAEDTFDDELTASDISGYESGYRSGLEVTSWPSAVSDGGQGTGAAATGDDLDSVGHEHVGTDGQRQRKSRALPQSTTRWPAGQDAQPAQPNRPQPDSRPAEPATQRTDYVNASTERPESQHNRPISDAESSRQPRRSGRTRRPPARLLRLLAASRVAADGLWLPRDSRLE